MTQHVCDRLRCLVGDLFHLYFRAHVMHWNVSGVLFPLYHELYKTIYTTAWEEVDKVAERIRVLGELAPSNIHSLTNELTSRLYKEHTPGTVFEMNRELYDLNRSVLVMIESCRLAANDANLNGLVGVLDDLTDAHDKFDWILRSTTHGD